MAHKHRTRVSCHVLPICTHRLDACIVGAQRCWQAMLPLYLQAQVRIRKGDPAGPSMRARRRHPKVDGRRGERFV